MNNADLKDILVFSDEYPPDGGGAGVVAKQLAKGLRVLGRNVDLLVGASGNRLETEVNTITCSRFTLVWPFLYAWKLIQLRVWRYQNFVLNDNVAAYLAGLWFTPAMLRRSVILIHGDDGKFFFGKSSLKHRLFGYSRFYRRALRYCKKVVAASIYARDAFIHDAYDYVDHGKVGYAYMGIDPDDFKTITSNGRAEIGVPDDGLLLFSASRLTEDKGLLDMLELFTRAQETLPNLYWHIAGTGPLQEELKHRITLLGLQDRVQLLGRLPRQQLTKYYKNADAFWLLSKTTCETFGLVYIEAAWFGCPSIALRIAGVPEALDEGNSGYFYEEGDDPAALISETARLNNMVCHLHAEKFLSINFARHLHQLLNVDVASRTIIWTSVE